MEVISNLTVILVKLRAGKHILWSIKAQEIARYAVQCRDQAECGQTQWSDVLYGPFRARQATNILLHFGTVAFPRLVG